MDWDQHWTGIRKARAGGRVECRESSGGRKQGGKALSQLWKVTRCGLNTEDTGSTCAGQDPAGIRQTLGTSREGVAGLWPHTITKPRPLNKPGCPNMSVRTCFTSTWQLVLCLHHPGRAGEISTERHLFSCGSSPRNMLLLPPHPHSSPRARQTCPAVALSCLQAGISGPGREKAKHGIGKQKEADCLWQPKTSTPPAPCPSVISIHPKLLTGGRQ